MVTCPCNTVRVYHPIPAGTKDPSHRTEKAPRGVYIYYKLRAQCHTHLRGRRDGRLTPAPPPPPRCTPPPVTHGQKSATHGCIIPAVRWRSDGLIHTRDPKTPRPQLETTGDRTKEVNYVQNPRDPRFWTLACRYEDFNKCPLLPSEYPEWKPVEEREWRTA